MRNKILISMLAAATVLFAVSCEDEAPLKGFSIGTTELALPADGGLETVHIESDGDWIANSTVPWITVSPTNGYGSRDCSIKVDTTLLANDSRRGLVRFTSKAGENLDLNVTQLGYENMIVLSTTEVELPNYAAYGKRYFDVSLTSNVPVTMTIPAESAWITAKDPDLESLLDRGARPRTVKLRFTWESNNRPQERLAEITFDAANGTELARKDALKVIQEKADEIADNREGDSLAIVGCARSLNYDMSKYEGEKMDNWDFIQLWEPTDENFTEDKRGRVRYLKFQFMNTKDGIPYEIQFLTKLESLSIFSNANEFLKSFGTGEYLAKLTQLKQLQIYAFGLDRLDEDFANLKNLEYLDISGNNFSEVPKILTPENFPKLTALDLCANRRRIIYDMSTTTVPQSEWGGFSLNDAHNFPTWLLKWENLEYLRLSNNYMQGEIPDMEDYDVRWTEEDLAVNDTLPRGNNNPAGYSLVGKPKVLPNCKFFAVNLNLFKGKIPEWILYHPNLMEWVPDMLVFNQDGNLTDMDGNYPGFTNVPVTPDYYYEAYPLKKPEDYDE
ncbi:MAG: BACON domain-containing protein [Candidatus Cryptobacteroides sp.]